MDEEPIIDVVGPRPPAMPAMPSMYDNPPQGGYAPPLPGGGTLPAGFPPYPGLLPSAYADWYPPAAGGHQPVPVAPVLPPVLPFDESARYPPPNAPLQSVEFVEYGRLIVLGYRTHRTLANGTVERVDRNSVFRLVQRPQGNGFVLDERSVRMETQAVLRTREQERTRVASMTMSMGLNRDASVMRPALYSMAAPLMPQTQPVGARSNLGLPAVTAPLPSFSMTSVHSPAHVVSFDFVPSEDFDMFQVGRHDSGANDFVLPGRVYEAEGGRGWAGPVSRYSFRILCNRRNPRDVRIYAGGFNEVHSIFLGPRAVRWEGGEPDALITYGLAIWKPETQKWVEISAVRGQAFEPRKRILRRGQRLPTFDNVLTDGTIIFNAGTTLLFRNTPDPVGAPSELDLANHLEHIRAKCPVYLEPIHVVGAQQSVATRVWNPADLRGGHIAAPAPPADPGDANRPWVFVGCGHVFSKFADRTESCPVCRTHSPFRPLHTPHCPAISPAYPTHVLPCGHALSSEAATKFLSIPIPGPTDLPDDESVDWNWSGLPRCPFCGEVVPGGTVAVKKLYFDRGLDPVPSLSPPHVQYADPGAPMPGGLPQTQLYPEQALPPGGYNVAGSMFDPPPQDGFQYADAVQDVNGADRAPVPVDRYNPPQGYGNTWDQAGSRF